MAVTLGFVLVTHDKPEQLKRLIKRLNVMFDYPNIACHHNFSITPLDISSFPENVRFVQPHIKTKWGKFSTIDAEMAALRMLYDSACPPDWFAILSGSDYPIKSAQTILHDLSSFPYDALIHHEIVKWKQLNSTWQALGYERYCTVKMWVPKIEDKQLKKRFIHLLKQPSMTRFFVPFSESFPCLVGDHFFCANNHIAEYLIEYYDRDSRIKTYYQKHTIFPTESYYQTILFNAQKFNLFNDNYRYIDWSLQGAHPKILETSDLTSIIASSAHFARKFDMSKNADILDRIDEIIL